MNNENRNFLLFAVLAVLILFGWPLLSARLFPTSPPATRIAAGRQVPVAPAQVVQQNAPERVRNRAQVLRESPRVAIRTPSLTGSLNLKGARIDDLVLNTYRQTVEPNSPPIRLLSPSGTENAYFASFGWAGDGVQVPNDQTQFTASSTVLDPTHPVTLGWTSPQGVRFLIRIAVDDRFLFTVTQALQNAGGQPLTARSYALISRTGVGTDPNAWNNHVGPIGSFNDRVNYSIDYAQLQGQRPGFFARIFGTDAVEGANYFDTTGGWLGFGDKYWLAALIPDQGAQVHSGFAAAQGDRFQADFLRAPTVVPAGHAMVTTTRFFAGAKEVNLIDRYEDAFHIPHFGRVIDWGWFEIIEKPIFKYLDWLFRLVGNFGVAIILLTITIRALMFPIAQRQFRSMAKMRAIQPKMKAVQERYKDDKVRQQQEVMALYKTEGANPLAGCAPTLLQIPIFFALYKVLVLTIEMRHQPFALWIRDLSAPDPLTPVNLFGLLPFTPPHMIALGVIPILYGISMYFQFKLNPQPMDEAQKQVFAFMPWILMFVMAPFAVGLLIYWICSNLITIGQQQLLYSRHPELKVAPVKATG